MLLAFVVLLWGGALAWAGDWVSNYHRMIFSIVLVSYAVPAAALVGLLGGLRGGLLAIRRPHHRAAREDTWTGADVRRVIAGRVIEPGTIHPDPSQPRPT